MKRYYMLTLATLLSLTYGLHGSEKPDFYLQVHGEVRRSEEPAKSQEKNNSLSLAVYHAEQKEHQMSTVRTAIDLTRRTGKAVTLGFIAFWIAGIIFPLDEAMPTAEKIGKAGAVTWMTGWALEEGYESAFDPEG